MAENTKIEWAATQQVEYRDLTPLGYPGYRVGDDGSVWSCWGRGGKKRQLTDDWHRKKAEPGNRGHLRVLLHRPGQVAVHRMVHRLALEAFVGPCPEGMEGCHEDGDPRNNRRGNLRWDTPRANWDDRRRHGRGCEGVKSTQAKLDDEAVRDIRESRLRGVRLKVLAARYGVSMARISLVARGECWRHVDG